VTRVPGGWIAIESCGKPCGQRDEPQITWALTASVSPKTGFPSSLRVSGCDKLHPGM
jgi:hypothetical protein